MDILIHSLYFVHPGLDSAPLFVGMRERSNDISEEFDEAEIRATYICHTMK